MMQIPENLLLGNLRIFAIGAYPSEAPFRCSTFRVGSWRHPHT